MERSLEVRIGDQRAGRLFQSAQGRYGVRFYESWKRRPDRDVLSLYYEDNGLDGGRTTHGLPPWFENLLPEGELRALLTSEDPAPATDDMLWLERVGSDLPGAVTLVAVREGTSMAIPDEDPEDLTPVQLPIPVGGLHFSLAGIQPKLSMVRSGDRYTLPVHGELGRFVAKFPARNLLEVARVEHATLRWARACGIDAASTSLVSGGDIGEVPPWLDHRGEAVLMVERFDRRDTRRVHIEDFAQALGLKPTEKYSRLHCAHHLKMIAVACPGEVGEYLRRLIFAVTCGNADAHHKNWSLVYPDGRHPRLAPAYDLVSTVQFVESNPELRAEDRLALRLAGSREWRDVWPSSFERLLVQANVHAFVDGGSEVHGRDVGAWATATARAMMERLQIAEETAGRAYGVAVRRHWARVPLHSV